VRLGGTLSYAGRVEHRPVLNSTGRTVQVADIDRAVRLSRRASWLALATCAGAKLLCGRRGRGAPRAVRRVTSRQVKGGAA
jgi:adenosylcobinamide-phosphate synthase